MVKNAAIESALQPFVDDHTMAGAIGLVLSPDGVLALQPVGVGDLQKKTLLDEDSLFWIASMTKPMTALAVMMLVEEGKLSIDDPVEKHLPEFKGQMLLAEKTDHQVVLKKPQRAITVKDILTHTSGLVSRPPMDASIVSYLNLKESVMACALSPLQFEPGMKWSYNNPGINTLGRLVEVISGKPYAEFMQERLFEPLGMVNTTFWPSEEQVSRLAVSYKPNEQTKELEPTNITFIGERDISDKTRMPTPAGGLFSTAKDLAKYYRMLLNRGTLDGRVYIKESTLEKMTTNHTGDLKVSFTDGMHMGLGFHIVNLPGGVTADLSSGSFGHGGAYGTQSWIDPVKKLGFILLVQRAGLPNSDGSDIRAALQKAAVQQFGDKK